MTTTTLQKTNKTPLHLRLTNSDWIECFNQLSRAELGVLYYIRTLDPYGDRSLEIDCEQVGIALGIHRTSVSRALEELKKKGLIDLEIEKVRVRQKINNRKLTLLTSLENESNTEQNKEYETCASTHSSVHPRTDECVHAQMSASTHSSVHPRTDECAHAQEHNNDCARDQTIQTNTNTTNKCCGVLEKFEEQLKRIQFYLRVYQGDVLVRNPKIEPITRVLANIPPPDAERSIKAFLQYAKTASVKNVYAAMFAFVQNRWSEK